MVPPMRPRLANVAAALAGVLPILLVCAVSMAHASAPRGAGPSAQASIVGGKQAAPGQFPSLAFIADFPPTKKFVSGCTGTVLTPRVILTAAHCTFDEETKAPEDPAGYVVVTGAVDWASETEPRQLSKVTRLIPYPKYASETGRDGFGDAALLVLETPTTAPPVPIATPANKRLIEIGTRGVIAGWGNTTFEQKEFTESLMWAHTTIGSDRCEGLWGRLCAIDFPEGRSGACHGDSGGPLLVHRRGGKGWVEVALTEAGFGKCSTRRPQLYTRTDLLAKWIGTRIAKIEAEGASGTPPSG
jgi:secreted trypsin-like serine protease